MRGDRLGAGSVCLERLAALAAEGGPRCAKPAEVLVSGMESWKEDDALQSLTLAACRLALDNSSLPAGSPQRPGPRPKGAVQPGLDNRPRPLLICCTWI